MTDRRRRRDRAAAQGFDTFLHQPAFDEIVDRLRDIARPFARALLVGCPDPRWPDQLRLLVPDVTVVDPSPILATRSAGDALEETRLAELGEMTFDLVVSAGTLHSVDNLPLALMAIRHVLRPDSLLIGTMAGGDSLPALRQAMRAMEREAGRAASPRVHPRIEPGALATLLSKAGFVMPVVDVERRSLAYRSLDRLISDLRATGETNILLSRDRTPIGRTALLAGRRAFAEVGDQSGRTSEQVDLLHFAAWTPPR